MSVSNVFVLFRYLLWKAKLDLSALSEGFDSSHINVSFSMGSIASCGVMKTPSCIIRGGVSDDLARDWRYTKLSLSSALLLSFLACALSYSSETLRVRSVNAICLWV